MFEEILDKVRQEVGVKKLPIKGKAINQLLRSVGSNKRLCAGFYGDQRNLIFGRAREEEIAGQRIIIFEQEDARTPNNNASVVAVTGDNEIFIREEACRAIFRKKWLKLFELSKTDKKKILYNPERNIGWGIKQKTLKLYGIKQREDLLASENIFLRDMFNNILSHEFGHNELKIDPDLSALGEASKVLGENIASILKELLADWHPHQGTLANIADQRDSRRFYMYLSDCWFLDTPNTALYPYAYLMASYLVKYINPDQSVDFARLNADLKSIYQKLLDQYLEIAEGLRQIIQNTSFKVEGVSLNFSQISIFLKSNFKKEDGFLDESSHQFKDAFWVNIVKYIDSFAPETCAEIKTFLKHKEEKILKGLKDSLIEKMKELGFWKAVQPLDENGVVSLVMDELKLTADEKKAAWNEFDRLFCGDYLRMSVSYQGAPRPFFMVLQKMLKQTRLGRIEDGMALEAGLSLNQALDRLADYFKHSAFLAVKLLRVNSDILPQNKMRQAIESKVLPIKRIEFSPMKNGHIFEVYTEVADGYPDWNTAQAIWRLNQEFRPQQKEKEWVLDRELFSRLAQSYLAAN